MRNSFRRREGGMLNIYKYSLVVVVERVKLLKTSEVCIDSQTEVGISQWKSI